jgi:hypothetical protein
MPLPELCLSSSGGFRLSKYIRGSASTQYLATMRWTPYTVSHQSDFCLTNGTSPCQEIRFLAHYVVTLRLRLHTPYLHLIKEAEEAKFRDERAPESNLRMV